MRRFIIKIIKFSFPIILCALFMEILLRNSLNDYLLKKNYLDKNSSKIETLILGSSHSYYGLDPKFFTSKTFNASHVSQTMNYDFKIIKKYETKFNNLKTIVLPISYFSCFLKLEESPESWRVKNYVIYYGMQTPNSYIYNSEVLSNKLPVNLKRIISYYIKGATSTNCTDLGWRTDYKSENALDLVKTGISAAKRHTKNIKKNESILKENITILEDIMEWCNKRQITLILFTPPAFKTYQQNLNDEQLNITKMIAQNIDRNNKNCIYIDLMNHKNFEKQDFYDGDHLSEIGAEKLSKLINKIMHQ